MAGAPLQLLDLPPELIRHEILPKLSGIALARLSTLSPFAQWTEPAAKAACLALWPGQRALAERWRVLSWKERLHIEDSAVGFDRTGVHGTGVQFFPSEPAPLAADGRRAQGQPGSPENGVEYAAPSGQSTPARFTLSGMGPRMLLSDVSTAGGRLLRWRLLVRGNTAVEFGVVPEAISGDISSLHKLLADPRDSSARAVGLCSTITAGSNVSYRAPIMRGTIMEVVAQAGRVSFLLSSESGAKEMHWVNGQAVPRPYKGPTEVRMDMEFPTHYDVRLAVTMWAKSSFDVLHPVAGLNCPAPFPGPGLDFPGPLPVPVPALPYIPAPVPGQLAPELLAALEQALPGGALPGNVVVVGDEADAEVLPPAAPLPAPAPAMAPLPAPAPEPVVLPAPAPAAAAVPALSTDSVAATATEPVPMAADMHLPASAAASAAAPDIVAAPISPVAVLSAAAASAGPSAATAGDDASFSRRSMRRSSSTDGASVAAAEAPAPPFSASMSARRLLGFDVDAAPGLARSSGSGVADPALSAASSFPESEMAEAGLTCPGGCTPTAPIGPLARRRCDSSATVTPTAQQQQGPSGETSAARRRSARLHQQQREDLLDAHQQALSVQQQQPTASSEPLRPWDDMALIYGSLHDTLRDRAAGTPLAAAGLRCAGAGLSAIASGSGGSTSTSFGARVSAAADQGVVPPLSNLRTSSMNSASLNFAGSLASAAADVSHTSSVAAASADGSRSDSQSRRRRRSCSDDCDRSSQRRRQELQDQWHERAGSMELRAPGVLPQPPPWVLSPCSSAPPALERDRIEPVLSDDDFADYLEAYSEGEERCMTSSPMPSAALLRSAHLHPRRVRPLAPAPHALQQLRDLAPSQSPLLWHIQPRQPQQQQLRHAASSQLASPECSPAQVAARMRLDEQRSVHAAEAALAAIPAAASGPDTDHEMIEAGQQ